MVDPTHSQGSLKRGPEIESSPPDALLLGASCDPLLLGEALLLCFLFLLLMPTAGFAPRSLLVVRTLELIGVGVALPVCTRPSPTQCRTHSNIHSLNQALIRSLKLSQSLMHASN